MEGVPVSIMESLMHGIPCIATNVGGTSEMIENDSNGYLVDCNFHPVDVAKKILALSTNETKWNSLSKKAREKYLSHFNSKKNYEDFYQALID
jgi:glycosyltransferase involved in cell wall biosynthesis